MEGDEAAAGGQRPWQFRAWCGAAGQRCWRSGDTGTQSKGAGEEMGSSGCSWSLGHGCTTGEEEGATKGRHDPVGRGV
uniref:Uncharacterized protein n=1 Tax=Triticum urartu TaxID=4572 RepID=A0A8R7PRD2_TRIUA